MRSAAVRRSTGERAAGGGVRDRRDVGGLGRKIRRDPHVLGGPQHCSERRPLGDAAAYEVGRLERKIRRRPALRQPREVVPDRIGDALRRTRTGQPDPIREALAAEPVKRTTPIGTRRSRPRCATIRQPSNANALVLRIGEPQPLAQSLGVFGGVQGRARRAGAPARAQPARAASSLVMLERLARSGTPARTGARFMRLAHDCSVGTDMGGEQGLNISIALRATDVEVRACGDAGGQPGRRRRAVASSGVERKIAGCAGGLRRCALPVRR